MQTVFIIAAVTASNAICFLLGTRRYSMPKSSLLQSPDTGIKKILQIGRKKEPAGTDPMDVIMANLETYDGTSFGQKEIPKG